MPRALYRGKKPSHGGNGHALKPERDGTSRQQPQQPKREAAKVRLVKRDGSAPSAKGDSGTPKFKANKLTRGEREERLGQLRLQQQTYVALAKIYKGRRESKRAGWAAVGFLFLVAASWMFSDRVFLSLASRGSHSVKEPSRVADVVNTEASGGQVLAAGLSAEQRVLSPEAAFKQAVEDYYKLVESYMAENSRLENSYYKWEKKKDVIPFIPLVKGIFGSEIKNLAKEKRIIRFLCENAGSDPQSSGRAQESFMVISREGGVDISRIYIAFTDRDSIGAEEGRLKLPGGEFKDRILFFDLYQSIDSRTNGYACSRIDYGKWSSDRKQEERSPLGAIVKALMAMLKSAVTAEKAGVGVNSILTAGEEKMRANLAATLGMESIGGKPTAGNKGALLTCDIK